MYDCTRIVEDSDLLTFFCAHFEQTDLISPPCMLLGGLHLASTRDTVALKYLLTYLQSYIYLSREPANGFKRRTSQSIILNVLQSYGHLKFDNSDSDCLQRLSKKSSH
jgi:hypothetical protein